MLSRNRPSAPVVETTAGRVSGAWKAKGDIAVFRGVPFAAPPVGERRWKAPQPVEPWDGVRSATRDAPMAIQRAAMFETFIDTLLSGQGWNAPRTRALKALFLNAPKPKESEDCLYLTVRTPSPGPEMKLPVMVWMHGGDHQDGSGTDVFYASNALASQGVVTVSINYRLGLMGYFAHPELAAESGAGVSGNYGTLDQIAALEWVRDNIANFGGDPDNVTIFGESAGGESVIHMMTSPLAQGLFHRAIPQSPANSGQMWFLRQPFLARESAQDNSIAFANAMGISGSNQLPRLRDRSPEELYALVRAASSLGDHFPVIDGHVLPESPLAAFAAGRQSPVPLLIGSNADEGTLIRPVMGAPMNDYRYLDQPHGAVQPELAAAFGDDFDRLIELYPGLDRQEFGAEIDFAGDHMFGGRVYWYARHHAAAGNPTWLYMFERTPPSAKQTAGAYHAAELPFVHGTNVPILPMTDEDKLLAASMQTYWTRFAKHSNPNGDGEVAWPIFNADRPEWLVLNHQIQAEPVSRLAKYEILNARTQRLVDAMTVDLTEAKPASSRV